MPNAIVFKNLNDSELVKSLGKPKAFTGNLPKKSFTQAEVSTKLKDWQQSFDIAAKPEVKLKKIAAVAIKSADVGSLKAIHESPTPTAEAIVGQKMSPDKVIGTLFTSLCALEFSKMESEYKTRLQAAATPAAKAKVNEEWANVVKAGSQVLGAGGLKNVNEAKLKSFSSELTKSRAAFNAIVNMANTAVAVRGAEEQALNARTVLKAGYVVETGVLADANITPIAIANLCSRPFAEGSFTRHFHRNLSLRVNIPYWCPTWRNPFRICHKTVTLAGISLDLAIRIGYRVTCCGAVAWGQASAQACATLVGITFCAGCTAQVTGVAGFGRTTNGSNCTYGFGINVQLKCTFGGVTILNLQAPFGMSINGPCPPAGFCR